METVELGLSRKGVDSDRIDWRTPWTDEKTQIYLGSSTLSHRAQALTCSFRLKFCDVTHIWGCKEKISKKCQTGWHLEIEQHLVFFSTLLHQMEQMLSCSGGSSEKNEKHLVPRWKASKQGTLTSCVFTPRWRERRHRRRYVSNGITLCQQTTSFRHLRFFQPDPSFPLISSSILSKNLEVGYLVLHLLLVWGFWNAMIVFCRH